MEKKNVSFVKFSLMKNSALLFVFFVVIIGFQSCQKEFSNENPLSVLPPGWTNNVPSLTTHEARLELDNLRSPETRYSFNNLTGTLATVSVPLIVVVPPSCFVKMDGSSVTGNVELIVTKATTYAEMMAHNLATCTANSLLSTDGMIKLSAVQGSTPLKIAPGKKIAITFPRSSNNDYKGFAGVQNNTLVNNISWVANNNWITDTLQAGQVTFPGTRIQIDSMQWVNCDYFYNTPNATNCYLKLPAGFGNANTITFAVFKNEKIMVGLYSDAANQRFWQGQNYKVPLNKNVIMVAVAKKDNKIYFGKVSGTTTDNAIQTIAAMEEVTQTELQARLNAL